MFNDHQDNQAQTNTDIDIVAEDISTDRPLGLGTNPSTFTPVMPPQAAPAPPAPANDDKATNDSSPAISSHNAPQVIAPTSPTSSSVPSGLDDIKQQALQQLSPLVSKLDQPPEERFKTLMMLIQASDNHDLIEEAYKAANAITDETVKAEALLAIVNEINYFTQQKTN